MTDTGMTALTKVSQTQWPFKYRFRALIIDVWEFSDGVSNQISWLIIVCGVPYRGHLTGID